MNKNETVAYIAGFFQGEGCVYIGKLSRCNSHRMSIRVAQVERDVLDLIQAMFGGSVVRSKKTAQRNARDAWAWQLDNKAGMRAFLTTIKPYMRGQKLRACEIGLEYVDTWDGGRGRCVPQDVKEKRDILWKRSRENNRTGTVGY